MTNDTLPTGHAWRGGSYGLDTLAEIFDANEVEQDWKNRLEAGMERLFAERNYAAALSMVRAELAASLAFLVEAAETEPGMGIYRAHLDQAKAALAKARAVKS